MAFALGDPPVAPTIPGSESEGNARVRTGLCADHS